MILTHICRTNPPIKDEPFAMPQFKSQWKFPKIIERWKKECHNTKMENDSQKFKKNMQKHIWKITKTFKEG